MTQEPITLTFEVAELQKRLGRIDNGRALILGEEHGVVLRDMLELDRYDSWTAPVTIVFPAQITSADHEFGATFMGASAEKFLDTPSPVRAGEWGHYYLAPEVEGDPQCIQAIGRIEHRIAGALTHHLYGIKAARARREKLGLPESTGTALRDIHALALEKDTQESAHLENSQKPARAIRPTHKPA